jgi:hypothetical protein
VRSVADRETFHPVAGPVAEAEALYVRQLRLPERMSAAGDEFVIWDVGLGAGANALTALRATRGTVAPVRILSFDHTLEPLRFGLEHRRALGYFDGYEGAVEELIQRGESRFKDVVREVRWEVRPGDFPRWLARQAPAQRRPELAATAPVPNAIFFDPFSPARNPEMWTQGLFANLFRLLDRRRPCNLATFSRSTMVRAALLLAGFFVGTGQPASGKEETTVAATALELIDRPLDRRWLQRARESTSAEPLRTATYRRARLSDDTWARLQALPQFGGPSPGRELT